MKHHQDSPEGHSSESQAAQEPQATQVAQVSKEPQVAKVAEEGQGIATYLEDLSEHYQGRAALYRLEPPLSYYNRDEDLEAEYVLVSAVIAPFSGPETYIFPCDSEGNVKSWGELKGSYRGGLNHGEALRGAGYPKVIFSTSVDPSEYQGHCGVQATMDSER